MNAESHDLPRETFEALARGGGGPAAVRLLAGISYSKLLLLLVGTVRRAAGRPGADEAERGYTLLAAVQDRHPDAVEAVLRHPPVRAWARHAARSLTVPAGRPGRDPELWRLGVLAAAAAIRAGFPCAIEVRAPGGVLVLPSLGRALLRGDRAVIEVTSEGAEIRAVAVGRVPPVGDEVGAERVLLPPGAGDDAPGWRGLRRLSAAGGGMPITLLVDDVDAYRMPAAPVAEPLADEEVAAWQATLEPAWDILTGHHRPVAEEIRAAVRVVTPLRPPAHGQASATGRDTFGCVAMSAPGDPQALAETLAHEVGHAKLTALLDIVALTLPDDGSRYYAPWRDDPRPVSGLLQGVYAYLGVTGFWRRERARGASGHADSEFARWRAAALMGAETLLAAGRLTAAGEEFVTGVRATLREWERDDTVPVAALARAAGDNERHRAAWARRNGPIPGARGTVAQISGGSKSKSR